jgi:hypothetical protein
VAAGESETTPPLWDARAPVTASFRRQPDVINHRSTFQMTMASACCATLGSTTRGRLFCLAKPFSNAALLAAIEDALMLVRERAGRRSITLHVAVDT